MREHPTRDPFVPVVRCAADLLAVVPHTLGYWPADSLVLFAAGGGTAGACVRVDLPEDPGGTRLAEAFVADLADLVGHDAVSDCVFAIVYTSSGTVPSAAARRAAGVFALVDEAAERAGRAVAARWVVAGEHWWAAEDPTDVRAVAWIRDSAVNAALVAAGSSYATAPLLAMDHEYGALPPGTGRRVAHEAARWARAGHGSWHHLDRLGQALAVWDAVLSAVECASADGVRAVLDHDDDLLGFLAASLSDAVLADLLLAACATRDLDGVMAAAALWAELCDDDAGAGGEPVPGDPAGPTRAPVPSDSPPVPSRPSGRRPGASSWPGARPAREPDAGELVRLSRVLAGECADAPDWARLDALYRVLQTLSWLLEAPGADGQAQATGPEPRTVLADVLVGLAQLNRFRARGSHTAHFVRRSTALVPGHPAALRVLRLAAARPVPLWARDRSTAWHA